MKRTGGMIFCSAALVTLLLCLATAEGRAQYRTAQARPWDRYPPELQKRGFGLNQSRLVQMDSDPALEEVFLFTSDNGHYPSFDLFRQYYLIVDNYTKEAEYESDIFLSTERELVLEDRNNDGRMELYRRYFKDNHFEVDQFGNRLSVVWMYDKIEWDTQFKK